MDIRSLGSALQSGTSAIATQDPTGSVTNTGSPATNANGTTIGTGTTASGTPTPATTGTPANTQGEPSSGEVHQAVQKINSAMATQGQNIQFSVDSTSHKIVVKIVDQQTNQVIRQIPSKEALAIADSIDQSQSQGQSQTQGLLIKQQA